jgi:TonB family protein
MKKRVTPMGAIPMALLLALAAAVPAIAGVTPELQRQIRATTFEIVMKKPSGDPVSYEKPLPLELLPYIERTDPYRSIGTAFALGPNTYVTAAHVLIVAIDSQYGAPAVRASDGSVHPIATVQKFSASEDFVVFSLADNLNAAPLSINRAPHVDDPVLAVGNALGEGIVIRDGLLTSETPEEQDGRWKWLRFSAAASPGNSGGPLLDSAGNIIGIVIAKSPNENLNYALPIANVLDAPRANARFDQRLLTKLTFAQGSQTYMLKDEFDLPLSWEKFAASYQALLERHSNKSREALLTAFASSMFPKGNGTDAILYGPDPSGREPELVIQQSDDNWVIQAPDFQFTDLPGDGKVGVASAAGAVLLAVHRGDEASDDAFYADSKPVMDIALKALNLRRVIGADQVKVVSLGAAVTDVAMTDSYGRKWQLRVWPVPFLDVYLVAQLLPTPDGYVGVIEYAPSVVLREVKAQLGLLANQVTLTYGGSFSQWQAFLRRRSLLPEALRDVTLAPGSGWTLRTRRFEASIPPALMNMDSRSRLLMPMNYSFDGPRVVWDIGSAWWYRDAKETAYIGLWRKPRPPSTAKLEARTRFDDLQARRSPYDGTPVPASSDAVDVSMGIHAPGTKDGSASSDVAYGLSLRVDGHPSIAQVAQYQAEALKAVHILERGVGQDVTASGPVSIATELDASLKKLRESSTQYDSHGEDIRGRRFSEDVDQYVASLYKASFQIPIGSAEAIDAGKTFSERTQAIWAYWSVAYAVVRNRDLWRPFLARNHQPEGTAHSADVLAAESSLNALIAKGGAPTAEWAAQSKALNQAYVDERKHLTVKAASDTSSAKTYVKRTTVCPEAMVRTSGTDKPRPGPLSHSLEEFYPPELKSQGVEGLVVLSVKVNSTGCVLEAAVAGSSGADQFDQAALKWVETASFLPAEKGGKPIEAATSIAVAFKLE